MKLFLRKTQFGKQNKPCRGNTKDFRTHVNMIFYCLDCQSYPRIFESYYKNPFYCAKINNIFEIINKIHKIWYQNKVLGKLVSKILRIENYVNPPILKMASRKEGYTRTERSLLKISSLTTVWYILVWFCLVSVRGERTLLF